MKIVTTEYIVYPPNYQPGTGYFTKKTLAKATNKAVSLGIGSTIFKNTKRTNKNGTIYQTEKTWIIK